MRSRDIITQASRVLVGLLFIFSGFIKADDPLGFSYKLDDYFSIFMLDFLSPYTVALSIFICILEIFLGICLLLGVYRRFTSWILLLMILFFTFLTFYSAYFNKVTDCGCFGDFLKLKPWTSFWKDIVLLVLILIIFVNRDFIRPLFNPKAARMTAWILLIPVVIFPLYCLYFLPPLDFRPYAVGKDIRKQMMLPPNAKKDVIKMTYLYKKNGKEYTFSYDDVMAGKVDSTYEYVDRKDEVIAEGDKPAIHDFSIYQNDANITDSFLDQKGYRLLIVQYDIEKSRASVQPKLNALAAELQKDGKIKIWPFSGSSQALNTWYVQTYHVPYQFFTVDPTVLKTIVRSNPGLVLLRDNVVVHMWPATALPDMEEVYRYAK